jgi:hypothetical protein
MSTAMYPASDPRSTLVSAINPSKTVMPPYFAGMQYGLFYETEPQEKSPGLKTWYTRGQTFTAVYSEAEAGAVLDRKNQPDEYLLVVIDREAAVEVTAKGETKAVGGYTVTFMPPGDSSIKVVKGGRIIRFFTERSEDIAAKASNAKEFAGPRNPAIPPLKNWPDPVGGFKIRSYPIDVPDQEGRIGRIYRSTTFMINAAKPRMQPRDITKMSPHSHDDFEQCSLVMHGTYVHHVRWPWLSDKGTWRPDEHKACGSTSVAFIPPHAVHTSEATDPKHNNLFDIFCPPRMDFSLKAGSVLNADEYPMPK